MVYKNATCQNSSKLVWMSWDSTGSFCFLKFSFWNLGVNQSRVTSGHRQRLLEQFGRLVCWLTSVHIVRYYLFKFILTAYIDDYYRQYTTSTMFQPNFHNQLTVAVQFKICSFITELSLSTYFTISWELDVYRPCDGLAIYPGYTLHFTLTVGYGHQ